MPIKSNYIASQQFNQNFESETLASYPESQSEYFNNPPIQKQQKKPPITKVSEPIKASNKYIELE